MEAADREHCRDWKLSAINPLIHTWRSGVRSAMGAASQLRGRGLGGCPLMWMLALYLHINKKSDDDDFQLQKFRIQLSGKRPLQRDVPVMTAQMIDH